MPDKPEREDSEPKIRDKTPRSWYKLCGFLSPLRFTGQGSGLCYTAKSEAINRIFTETASVTTGHRIAHGWEHSHSLCHYSKSPRVGAVA
eukprot:1253012-Rhodomonas_salina.2